MRGYFGTDLQQRLQRQADEWAQRVTHTPGLCNAGRVLSCDDVDTFGLEACAALVERDGGLGFRLVPAERTGAITAFLAERGCRIDWWDTFAGAREACLPLAQPIVAAGPPPSFRLVQILPGASEAELTRLQAFLAGNGLAPFSRATLAGETVKGRFFALFDEAGEIAATAFAYLPHNEFSAFAGHAWGGLAAVAPAHRGKALGRYINARAAVAAFEELGAATFYEQVSAENTVSRRMVEACGLTLHPTLKSGLAAVGAEKFTR